jgi:hypothetical protein
VEAAHLAPPSQGTLKMPKTKSQTTAAKPAPADKPKTTTKTASLIALLRRPEGARIDEMMQVTGWQQHSVRGAIAGALKKKLGLTITSDKTEAGRVYRIVEAG